MDLEASVGMSRQDVNRARARHGRRAARQLEAGGVLRSHVPGLDTRMRGLGRRRDRARSGDDWRRALIDTRPSLRIPAMGKVSKRESNMLHN